MNKMERLSLLSCVLFFMGTLWPTHGYTSDDPAEDVYKVGQTRVYEIAQPRTGFVGSPTEHIQRAFWTPTRDEHFNKEYVAVEVVEKRSLSNGQKVALRVDGIDKEGRVTKKGLYAVSVDISSKGTQVIARYTDEPWDQGATDTRHPFNCSKPPALGFKKDKVDGYVFFQGHGVMYAKKTDETASALTVEVTRFENPKAFEKDADRTIHWYGSHIADLAEAGSGAAILFREKQLWDKADDWLWRKMERLDAKGNVLMRCVRTK